MTSRGDVRFIDGPAGQLAVELHGAPDAPVVLMAHSILSSRAMWRSQAERLVTAGYRVALADTRGHGDTPAVPAPYAMADLVADSLAILDDLQVERAHYVGLSLGGMSGFGLAINHGDRLSSIVLCDARADAPPPVASPWDERIVMAQQQGCAALAMPTIERWFGAAFLDAHPDVRDRFHAMASATLVEGFVGCARAIQSLDYIDSVSTIRTPTTLVVGSQDGVLPQVMAELAALIPGACLEVIDGAGHLPNIDQPAAFDDVLMRHLKRFG